MPGRFLQRRAESALEQAEQHVEVSVRQLTVFVGHADALAARMEALPLPPDLDSRRARRERVRRLREAAAAGHAVLRRRAEQAAPGPRSATGRSGPAS